MRHSDQAHLLADLCLALPGLAIRRHVGDLADETRGAGLAAGVRIHLGIEHQHLDRNAGGQHARQVLEPDVVHRAIAADADDWRTQLPFLVTELLPVEIGEEGLVFVGTVLAVEFHPGLAHHLESLGHLAHVPFEDAHRDRRRVLEQVAGPRERIGVERIGRAPHRRTAGGIDDAHLGPTIAGLALGVLPFEVAQLLQQLGDPAQPFLIDRLGATGETAGQLGQRQVAVLVGIDRLVDLLQVRQVHAGGELEPHVRLETIDQVVDLGQVTFHPWLHQCGDRTGEHVDHRLFTTAHAGAVAGQQRLVVRLVEQQCFERTDLLFEVVDADEVGIRGRQIQPEIPVTPHLRNRIRGLRLGDQGQVVAHLDTFHAALAGVRIDGDREQPAAALLFLFAIAPVRLGDTELEVTQLGRKQTELLLQRSARIALQCRLGKMFEDGLINQCGDVRRLTLRLDQRAQALLHATHLAAQIHRRTTACLDAQDRRGEHITDRVDQPGDRAVRAHGVTVAAGGAVLGDELRILKADLRHIAEDPGRGRYQRQRLVGVGEVVVATSATVERTGLLPEAMDVRDAAVGLWQRTQHHRQRRFLALGCGLAADDLVGDLEHLVETAPHHAQVVLHDALALVAELVAKLVLDRLEKPFLVQPCTLHQRRCRKERTLEGVALHTELQFDVGGLFAGDPESVHEEHADVVFDDETLCLHRNTRPGRVGIGQFRLHDEHPALLETEHRVRVGEHIGIRRHHHVDEGVLAVQTDRFRRRGQEVGGWLPFLLRSVLRIGADIEAQQFVQRHRQVLAGGDRTPATDRVHAHRDRTLGQQVRVFAAAQRQLTHPGIAVGDLLHTDLVFRICRLAHEVDAQVVELAPLSLRQHVLDRRDQSLRLQIARPQSVGAGVQRRQVGMPVLRIGRIGLHAFVCAVPILQALAQRRAHLAHDRQVFGQRLVGALEHRDTLASAQYPANEVTRERPEHRQVDDPYLDPARVAQVVDDRLGLHDHAALPDDQVFRIVDPVGPDPVVTASGERVVLVHHLVGDATDVFEEVRALGGNRLHVRVLVLYRAREHRVVDIPDLRYAPAFLAIYEPLRGCRAVDDVVGASEELLDQRALRHLQGLDQMRGQEAVLADCRRGQRQLGDLARDQVEIGRTLCVVGEYLEEAGVVDTVVVIMTTVHVERGLGDRTAADVEQVRQTLSDRRVQRLVHERHTLRRREVRGAQTGHRHAGGNRGRRMLGLGLDEHQRPAGDVDVPLGRLLRPVFPHLRGWRDRIGTRGIRRLAFAHDDGAVAVHRHAYTRVLELLVVLLLAEHVVDPHVSVLPLSANRQRCLSDDFPRVAALDDALVRLAPHDCPGRAALDRDLRCQAVLFVVDHCEVVADRDQALRRVDRTTLAGGADHLTLSLCRIAEFAVAARHPQPVTDRVDLEQVLGAHIHAVTAGSALRGVHDRQAVTIHMNGVKGANGGAVAHAQASPGAALATTGDQAGAATAAKTGIRGADVGHVCTAGTRQACHALFVRTQLHTKEVGDDLVGVLGIDRAQARVHLALHQLFGERPAARRTAGTAVGLGQEILDIIDARILQHEQPAIGDDKDARQDNAQRGHESHRYADKLQGTQLQVLSLKRTDSVRLGLQLYGLWPFADAPGRIRPTSSRAGRQTTGS